MTVFSLLKGAFLFISFLGLIFTGVGAWKVWSAYDFARKAEVTEGIFRGYHSYRHKSSMRETSGERKYRMVEEHLPMFAYKGSGRRYEITGTDTHIFRHLESKVNEPVKVLVSPDDPKVARLGDAFSLYGSGGFLGLASLIFVILPWYGAGVIDRWRSAELMAVTETQTTTQSLIANIGQANIPVHDFVIIFGGFLLVAGTMGGTIYYVTSKRQSMSLVETIQAGDYNNGRRLAAQGRGIDAKTPEGETALILALKANQPEVAHAILENLWVNTHVTSADGISAVQMAAVNGDRYTLALLLKKEQIREIKPAAIYHLIRKGDAVTLQFIVDQGFDLKEPQPRPSYGDQAVLEGQAAIVRIIQKHNGPMFAPVSFVALATDDVEALRNALEVSEVSSQKFLGFTLERFAEKIGRSELLALTLGELGKERF